MAATLNRKTQRTARNAVCFFSMMHALFAVVLLVGDLFHPCNVFPVDGSRNGDMCHGGGGGGGVPMFDPWRGPEYTTPPFILSCASPPPRSSPTPGAPPWSAPAGAYATRGRST